MRQIIIGLLLTIGLHVNAQNTISISLNSESYDCATGLVSFSFHISNADENGNSSNYHTIYNVYAGASQSVGKSLAAGEGDVVFSGAYNLGDQITISAYGISNNGAPLTSFDFVASSPSAPSKPNISGDATTLCNGAAAHLYANGSGYSYTWSTGDVGSSITVFSAGSYTVHESNYCGVSPESDPWIITAGAVPPAPAVSNSNGTFLCNGASTNLSTSPSSGGTIYWSTGATGNAISVSSPGSYYAYETNACGQGSNSSTITITTGSSPSAPSIGSSLGTLLCNGSYSTLSGSPSGGGTIHWSTGASGSSTLVNAAGNYYAYESNGCGAGPNSNTISITTGSSPAAPTIAPSGNQLLCNGASVNLSSSGSSITWSNGATGNSISVSIAGTYYSYDRNACGNSSNSNSVSVNTVVCPTPVPGSNFLVCPGAQKTLDAGGGYDTYLWSNGQTTQSISVGPGTYTVTVTKNGCSAVSSAVTVGYYSVATPTISASSSTTFCSGNSVTLSASSGTAYAWNTGASSSSISVSSSGAYYVTVTDGNGCQATSVATTVTVNPLPSATISGNASVCKNATAPSITFTGSGATAPYTFTYKINGGSNQTISTTSGNSISVSVPTSAAGTFTYTLVSVQESSGTACSNAVSSSATVVVSPLPSATISGSTTLCQNSFTPIIVFSGSGATAPYTFTYQINGGATQTITTPSGNSVGVGVPSSVAGTFVYSLLSVKESGSNTCLNSASGTATIIVNPLPTATISGSTTVCQNGTAPMLTFTGSNATAPYTFTYKINNGSNQTVSTVSGNSVSVSVPTSTAGTFTYTLVSVKESSGVHCSATVSGTATVTVNPQPVAAIISSPATHLCNGDTGQITITNWTSGYTYNWFKDGVFFASTSINVLKVTQAGSYAVMVISDKGCNAASNSNAIAITTGTISTPIITGYKKVCEGGKTQLKVLPKNSFMPYEIYRWTDTPIGDSISNSQSFSAYAGQYRVLVARQGCYDSTKVLVTANDTEFPAGTFTVTPKHISYGEQATLTAAITDAAQFQWYLGDSLRAVTSSNVIRQNFFTNADSVVLKVKAISQRNCITEFSTVLRVGERDTVVIPDHSFFGNLKDWNVFPVPFHNELKVSVVLTRNENIRLDLFTVSGAWIKGWQFSGKKGENLFSLDGIQDLYSAVMYVITGLYNNEKHSSKIYKY